MRTLLIALIVSLVAAAPAAAAPRTVKLGDDWFVREGPPRTVTVVRGTTVRWKWTGSRPHNVVAQSGPVTFQSSVKRSGTYRRKMRRRGIYRIVCSIHAPDMRMTLKVK
jgi:plastocyanin